MQAADDIIAIQQLLAAYVFAIDAKDYDALDAVFLPGATVDYRAAGGAAGTWPTIARKCSCFSRRSDGN